MRTFRAVVGLVVLFVLMRPSPAHAWWDWLDQLSGPGKFSGPQFQFRLACFGGESAAKQVVDDLKRASEFADKLRDGTPSRGDFDISAQAWRNFEADLKPINRSFPVLTEEDLTNVANAVKKIDQALNGVRGQPTPEELKVLQEVFDTAEKELRVPVTKFVQTTAALNSTSMIVSGCSPNRERRTSLDIAVSFLHADGDPAFADSEEIRLTMLMPVFSFRVLHDPRYDVLDAGVGGGVYWFTSKGFSSFSGLVLQPGYLDFHPPTRWNSRNYVQRVLGAFSLRYGVIVFPAGFAADAFAGTGPHHVRIPGELIKTWGIFWTVDPYVHGGTYK